MLKAARIVAEGPVAGSIEFAHKRTPVFYEVTVEGEGFKVTWSGMSREACIWGIQQHGIEIKGEAAQTLPLPEGRRA